MGLQDSHHIGRIVLHPDNPDWPAVTVAQGQRIDLVVELQRADGTVQELLTTLSDQSISNLGPGKSKNIKVSITIPDTVAPGEYRIAVTIDSSDTVVESDENNNAFTIDTPIHIEGAPLELTF